MVPFRSERPGRRLRFLQAGAYMNDSFQAKDGIRQEDLRADVPIYTGHYHKPHTVEGTRVQYVGSPYQVSRGEAGQQKQLLVLDKVWKVRAAANGSWIGSPLLEGQAPRIESGGLMSATNAQAAVKRPHSQ
jgi:hypothetical protein